MPSYTLIILGRDDRGVRGVEEIHADTEDAARRQAQTAAAQFDGQEPIRVELWCDNRRVFVSSKFPK